jgi:hypothetical protein
MPAKFRFGIVAMCDAVYKDERTNKGILAGVYSGDVVAEKFPLDLPVGFYIEVTPDTGGSHRIELRFCVNGKHRMGAIIDLGETLPGVPAMLLLPTMSIPFENPCLFEVKFCAEGSRTVSILKKAITQRGPAATASPLSPTRSRRAAPVKAPNP